MERLIYHYQDYVEFLVDWIQSRPRKGRGIQAKMAEFVGCYPVHINRVLKRSAHLTMEQTARLINYMEMGDLEGQYFFHLVEMGRARNNELREFLRNRLAEIKGKWEISQFEHKGERLGLTREDYEIYYESWLFEAIDKLVSIPKYQKVGPICDYLNLSKGEVLRVLNFLIEKGLIKKEGDRYIRDLTVTVNLPPAEIFWKKHHTQWRHKAISSFDHEKENNLSINVLTSLSEEDVPRLIKFLHEKAEEMLKIIEKSPREELRCICIDFFKVK